MSRLLLPKVAAPFASEIRLYCEETYILRIIEAGRPRVEILAPTLSTPQVEGVLLLQLLRSHHDFLSNLLYNRLQVVLLLF